MGKTSTDRSAAAVKANETRRANERERQVMAVVEQLRSMQTFTSPQKEYARTQVALFLSAYGGPVADMHGPGGGSARVMAAAGLDVISAENGGSELFKGIRRDLLRAALARTADGFRFHFGDVVDILPGCGSAFLDACGPLYVDSPSAGLVRAAVAARLDAFCLTVMLARVEGVGGGKDRSAAYYISLARTVLAEDAPMYRVRRVLRYAGEANTPFAVFMLERHECGVEGCGRRIDARGFCRRHYDQQPDRVAARKSYLEANPGYLAEWRRRRREYMRNYYPNWVMNPAVREGWLKYHRDYSRRHHAKPENRARARELRQAARSDPEYRRRERERDEATRRKKLAAVSGTAAEAVNSEVAA